MSNLRQAAEAALEALGLWATGRDMDAVALNDLIAGLEAALADGDNMSPAEPVQEPVAWVECDGDLVWNNREAAIGRNLYTAPPQRPSRSDIKPLTDDEIAALTKSYPASSMWRLIVATARAIEQAHGIEAAGCDHCRHPLYAAIKCSQCGRVTE